MRKLIQVVMTVEVDDSAQMRRNAIADLNEDTTDAWEESEAEFDQLVRNSEQDADTIAAIVMFDHNRFEAMGCQILETTCTVVDDGIDEPDKPIYSAPGRIAIPADQRPR